MERFFLKNCVVGGLASLLLAVLLSCGEDAGLGASIDTKAPTLSITYPDSGAAIRDSFILAGDCSDDKSISRILVTVKNLESGVDYGSYPAKVSVDQTSWQVELNPYDSNNAEYYNGWQLPDGKYEFSVTAYDNAGNNSGVSSRQFEIDNTPPVFIISNPGVVKSSGLKASAYGSLFTIDGTISDNHPISYMDVKIFRTSDGQLLSHETYEGSAIDFYREEDIATAGGSSVTIAQWSDTATQTAKTRYTDIYGDNVEAGTIEYFAQIALYDSAKVYKNPPKNSSRSAVEIASDVYGNSTSTVYLYDDVYTALMSAKKGLGLSAANLKDILAGLDKGEKATAALSTLSTNAKNTEVDANRLYFSLNPQANPTYTVNGYKFNFASNENQLASSGNTVSVTVSAGLDGTNIQPDLVKVWIKKYASKPTDEIAVKSELEKLNQKVIELTKEEAEFVEDVTTINLESGNDWILVYDYAQHNDKGSSVATKTFAVTLPAIEDYIELEKFYILGVTGHDVDEVCFSQNIVYGFEGNAAGVPPTFAFDDTEGSETPKSLSIWNDFATPKFSGTAIVSTGSYFVKEITAKLTLKYENTNATVGTYTDTMISNKTTEGGVVWTQSAAQALSWDYDANKWKIDLTKLPELSSVDISNKQLLASLEISGKSSSGHSGSTSRDIHIDTVAPVVTMTSITPSVSGSEYFGNGDTNTYLNGNITIKGNVEEQNLKNVSYDILASTDLGKTLAAGDSILEDLKTRKTELGLDAGAADGNFDGSLGKQFTLNIPFATTAITKLFHDYKGAEEDATIQVELVVTAVDEAGNTGSYSSKTLLNSNGKNYVVYQRTDRPKITLGNADAAVTSADGINVDTNLFGTTNNNKLQISFEDDDSVAEYKIYIYKEDGTELAAADTNDAYGVNPYVAYPGKTSASVNFLLPSNEGKYQVKIEAKDYLPTALNSNPYGEETVGNFFIAVDSGAPNITITKPVAGSYQNGTVQVEGTVSKKVEVEITGKLKQGNAEVAGATVSAVTIGAADNGVYKWTGTVTLPGNASGSYTLDYEAKDVYGQKTSTTVGFVVDVTAPTFAITTPTESEVFTAEAMYTVKGTISDGKSTSGIKGLYWTLTEPTANDKGVYEPLNASGALNSGWNQIAATPTAPTGEYTWIANIELPDDVKDGTASKTVYICVIDEAGNVSKISENAKSNSLKITLDNIAPETTLLGTGLKKPAKNVDSSETGTKDLAGNLILAENSELDETITYYSTDATNGYTISGVVTEASGVSNVTVKVDGTEVSLDSTTGKWTFNEKTTDGTYTHQIVITDKAGNSVTKKVSVIRDTKNPELSVSNDTNDNDALNVSKVITEKNVNYSYSDGVHYYLLSGKWKDTTSGTYKLQYRVAPKHEGDAYSDTWSDWRDISDVTQSTAETSWSVKVPMTEGKGLGSGVALQGRAIDAAGNVFEHEGHSGLKLDFSAPTIAAGSVKKNNTVVTDYKYVKEGETLVIEGTCADSYALDEINVVAKKDGTAVSTGTNGLVIENVVADGKKSGTFKITLTAGSTNNGKWEFEVKAKDWVERESQTLKFSTLVDTVKPEWNASDILVDKKTYSEGTNHSWYKNSTLPFSGSLTENGSGIKEIRYTITKADGTAGDSDSFTTSVQKDDSGNVEKETFSTKLGEFLSKKDGSGVAQANTVTLVAEDEAGNVSDLKTFKIYIDSEVPTVNSTLTGSQYSNKSLKIDVTGTSSDDSSGVESVKLFITVEGSSDPLVIYKETDDTEIKEITAEPSATGGTLASWSAEIPATFLATLEDKTYAVKATVTDKAGNKATTKIFSIDVDGEKPTIKNVALSDESDKYSVYEKTEKINNVDTTVYYAHNAADTDNENVGKKFSITGSVQDAKSGIKSIVVSDGTREIVSKRDGKDITSLPITDIDLSSYTDSDSVELTLTVTDNAGNTKDEILTVKFDNAAPTLLHAIDTKQKDVFFRIGENDNDDIDEKTVDSNNKKLWNNALDTDVGGKYSEGTYGNSKTIKIRGTVDDKASGAAMIYYKVISESDLAGVTETNLQEKLNDMAKDFLKKYKTEKTGSFAPGVMDADKTRRVFYTGQLKNAENKNITLGGTDEDSKAYDGYFDKTNGTSGTISGKNYASIYTNFNSVLSGFSTGKNYLIFVIVDNVGNADWDSVTTTVNGTESTFHNISLNVDQTPPYAKSDVDGIKYTNKAENTTLEFTGETRDEDAGLYSITLKQGTKEITVKNDAADGKTTNEFGTLEITKVDGDKKWTWKATVKNDKFFEGAANGDTVSVSLEAKDCAGIGNTKSINAATVIIDTQLDSVTLSAPADADTETSGIQINGTITLEGTINDTNVLPGTAITRIEYKKASDTAWTEASTTTMPNLALSGSYTFKAKNFDTTKLDDGTYYLRAVGKDSAGNEKASEAVEVKINQDTDRPKVNFNNIEWNDNLGKFLLRQGKDSQLTGRISDDDASLGDKVVKKLYITEESYTGAEGETEPTTNYASSSGDFTFEPSITIDGEKTVYIYIEDNGGQTFWTKYTSVPADATTGTNDKLKNPKILVNSTAYANKDDAKIEYISDSNNPIIGDANGMPYSKSGDVYKEAATANANLNASFLVGGVNKKYVKLIFSAKDFNGIGGMMAKISDTGTHVVKKSTSSDFTGAPTTGEEKITDYTVDVGENKGTFEPAATADPSGYKNAVWTTDYIDFTGWTTGQVTVKLWVYDRIGNAASGTFTFVVDNTPPEIKITTPANGEEKTGNVTIIGTAYDKGDAGTTNIQWLVPTTTEVTTANEKVATTSLTAEQAKFEYLKNLTTTVKKVSEDTGEEKDVPVSKWNGGVSSLALDSSVSVSSWQFDFDGLYDDNSSHPDKFIFKVGNPTFDKYDSNTFAENNNSASDDYHGKTGIYKLPVYFMATDELGNYSIEEVFKILHNPDGDKPKVTITYPTSANYDEITVNGEKSKATFATLGGTIAVTGSAEIPSGTTSVKKVYLQIADSDGAFNATDKAKAGTGTGNYGFTVVNAYKAIKDATGKEYVSAEVTDGKTLMTDAIAKDYGFANKAALDAWWGIEVSSTTSWRIQLNASGSMNPTGNTPNSIKIRACGINANGKMGAWTQGDDGVIAINIDNGVPVLSASVVQYKSAITNAASLPAVVASQHYSADMFLRGENWYVVLDARDESGISSVEVKNDTILVDCKESALEKDSNNNKSGKRVYIPIASNVTAVSYEVVAYDVASKGQQPHSSKATYSFKIDNHAPSIESVKDGTDAPLSESKQNTVSNSNYVYTIQGVSDDLEDGSGVERIVFYYMRKAVVTQTSIRNEVVLDPMIKPTGSDYSDGKLPISGTGALKAIDLGLGKNKPVLYAKEISGNVSEEETGSGTFNKFTAADSEGNFDHIRAGGLVKIDGIYRKISTVDGKVVTFTPPATAASTGITAQFPIAQVIDANNTAKNNIDNPFVFVEGKDDGDKMVESFSKSGSSWTWDASIHSQNMSDGPATLVILAFDKAGNVAGKYFNVMVSNNAPRLAKVYLGTDLNHDDAYSENEFETYNIGAATGNTDGEETYELTTANFQKYSMKANLEWAKAAGTRTSFTIKNNLAILPEFVGGNGTMKLVFSNNDSRTVTASDGTTSGDMTGKKGSGASLLSASGTFTPTVEMVGVSNVSEEDRNSTDSIKNSLTEKSYWELTDLGSDTMTSSAAAATTKSMSFTFWDDTDECTQGDNSQYAFLRVKDFIVDQDDDIAPNVVVDPFKWEGAEAEKNNLYYASGSTTPLGHVELEGDLPTGTFKTTNTGEYDRDPKVSGKIVIRGTAYDETLLGKLTFSMTNFKKAANATSDTEFDMATYQTGENAGWSVESKSIDDDGYQITVEDVSIGQDGHKVNWSVAIDTSMLSDVAHTDAVFSVIATDNGKSNSSANSTGTSAGTTDATKHKPTYKMDVVPYITGIKNKVGDAYKKDASVFGRSATGAYPVYYYSDTNCETFTVNGFNFGTSPKVSVNGGTATTGNTVTVTSTMTSGGVVVTVGSGTSAVSSLNNVNNNEAKGDYDAESASGYDKFKNYYNRQPNNVNNSTLTDDCKVSVWNVTQVVSDSNIRYPTMRVGTDTNQTIAFVYDSSSDAVKAYKSTTNATKTPFELGSSFTQWYDTAVAVDSNGNLYGSGMNGDTGSGDGNARYNGNNANNLFFAKNTSSNQSTWAYSTSSYGIAIESGKYNGQFYSTRVINPKIATDKNNALYMVYYDSGAQQVRFRYGLTSGQGGFISHGGSQTSATPYHVIAGAKDVLNYSAVKTANTSRAGEYVAVGATNETTPAAIVVWYSEADQGLYYTYNKTPSASSGWSDAVLIDDNFVGWYVDLVVDGANGVHIAYYDASNGDLKYAYVQDYTNPSAVKTMTVDSFLSSGTNISISVKKVGSDYVPYISSFMSSFNKTSYTVRTAWITDGSLLKSKTADELKGVDGNDDFTGVWEVMTVPLASTSIPLDYSVGIGIKSNQPILGYGTQNGLETATLK